MTAHFFDLTTLIKTDAKVWIVSKLKPSIPILKLDQSDFNLIKKGVWLNNGEKIKVNNSNYWFNKGTTELLKIKCAKTGVDMSDLAFSMQEFLNPEIIDKLDFQVFNINFEHLKNSKDDIYIICSKNTKVNSEVIIKKLEDNFREIGILVKNYYYISETFYNRNDDDIAFKKTRLFLQHLIGLKTEGDKFTDEEITKYENIFVYDTAKRTIHEVKNINQTLELLKSNSDDIVKSKISDRLKTRHTIILNEVTFNKVNRFITSQIDLIGNRIIKTYESFVKRF